jgi:hypothetical protein
MSASDDHWRKDVVAARYMDSGWCLVSFDTTFPRVDVPAQIREKEEACLLFGRDLPVEIPDLSVNEYAIGGTLSFGGKPYPVSIPWDAVFTIERATNDNEGSLETSDSVCFDHSPSEKRQHKANREVMEAKWAAEEMAEPSPYKDHAHYLRDEAARARCAETLYRIRVRELDEVRREPIVPGDVVMLVNMKHCDAQSRVSWKAVACDCESCASGRLIAVDEPGIDGGQRHVAKLGVRKRGEMSSLRAESWVQMNVMLGGSGLAGDGPEMDVISRHVMEMALTDALGGIDTFQQPAWEPDLSARVFEALSSLPDNGHVLDHGHYNLSYIRKAGHESTALYRWSVGLAMAHGVETIAYADAIRAAYRGQK